MLGLHSAFPSQVRPPSTRPTYRERLRTFYATTNDSCHHKANISLSNEIFSRDESEEELSLDIVGESREM